MNWALAALGLLTAGVLLALLLSLVREQRRSERLQRQLEAAAENLQLLQETCTRLAPAGLVQQLASTSAAAGAPAAERRIATALFADLVGYTAMSERLEPAELARVLNGYFQRMSDAIHDNRGHVSTYLGDGILAYFGALQPNPWQCGDAVRAALAMRQAMQDYNVSLENEGMPRLAVGVGIHRGPGLAGLIGSRERMEFGFVGRTVNLAARVQSLTRVHQVDILITDAVRAELDAGFELSPMPPEAVKGIAEPVLTYAVRGLAREPQAAAAPVAALSTPR
jgi:class 3 adenylate cyclase